MANLFDVAEHLSKQAKSTFVKGEASFSLADAYGRSAFNRYYYASFLSVRDLVSSLDAKWGRVTHDGVPELLRKAVYKKINGELLKAEKSNFLTSQQYFSKKSLILTSLDTIASIMAQAYTIRGIVDYEPEIKISFEKNIFKVNTTTVTHAQGWLKTIHTEKSKIIVIMKEIGLV